MPYRGIGREIRSLNNLIMRYFEQSRKIQYVQSITGSNSYIIRYLAEAEQPIYQKDIEARFSITRSTTSRVLALMEKKGLIERRSVNQDKRLKQIKLTDEALELYHSVMKDIEAFETILIKNISEETLQQFERTLQIMKDNLKQIDNDS